ncbi:MAG: putative quinol monooxygenase [Roseiflexaceae bacterium]|nr:antibiotic biosynthesis monooxygenase [Roseiflexus sp.]MDW8215058.1 putative quinol monooxygenase [Roseiflexaceae bacterium]
MIVLVARYVCKPGLGDAVEEALRRMAALVRRHEPGCLLYHCCRSQENPDVFLLYEQYATHAALAAHRDTPHFQRIIEGEIVPMLEKREREFYSLIA